jgi:hypothetical protein
MSLDYRPILLSHQLFHETVSLSVSILYDFNGLKIEKSGSKELRVTRMFNLLDIIRITSWMLFKTCIGTGIRGKYKNVVCGVNFKADTISTVSLTPPWI